MSENGEKATTSVRIPWRVVSILAGSAVALNGILWFLVWFVVPRDQAAAVLHYRAVRGIDYIGSGGQITILPVLGLLLGVINIVIGAAAYAADQRTAWVLWTVTPLFQIVLLTAFYFVWQAN